MISAQFGTGSVALLVAGTIVVAIGAAMFALRWVASFPDLPTAGARTSDLGPESPALANLLVNRCKVTSAAAAATLVDLAARRWLLLFEAGPGQYIVRIQPPRDDVLTEYEQQVLGLVRKHATGGSAPLEAIELEQSEAEHWRSDFAKKVLEEAKQRGLVRRRWNRHDGVILGAITAVALALIAGGLYFARVESNPQDTNGFDREGWFVVAGLVWFGLMTASASLRAVRYSAAGEQAAARWLGVKQFLREQSEFADATPASVAIWNRLLAYGAGIGVARGALDGIPLEVEDPDVAWSRYDGQWRQVAVEYPTRFGYGERPLTVLGGGVMRLAFWGAIGFVFLPIVVDILWALAQDLLGDTDLGNGGAWLVLVFVVVFGALGGYLVVRIGDGLIRTYFGLMDLRATKEITGSVVKHYRSETHQWFAVDPGGVEAVNGLYWEVSGPLPPRGSTVRVVVTPHLHHLVSVEPSTERSA